MGILLVRHLAKEAAKMTAISSTSGSSSSDVPQEPTEPDSRVLYEVPLAVLILILYVVLGHSLELWKDHQAADAAARSYLQPITRHRPPKPLLCTFHESGPAILLGLAVGLMMNYGAGEQFDFDADIFFYVVLPPIIFHQGYAFKKRNFFKYFHHIFSFGIIGTLIQFAVITLLAYYLSSLKSLAIIRDDGVPIGFSLHECMLMAAVLSAADEVATLSLIKQSEYPKLSAVLFGEGVMNDAMSILLFHAVTTVTPAGAPETSAGMSVAHLMLQAMYLLITAGGVGVGSGLLVSVLLKSLPSLKTNSVRQTAILMLGGYFSFSVSEALELSGVLTVFFCGLTLSHYAWHSLGTEAQVASKITSDTISMIAEAYCFAAIGLSVHEFDANQWCVGFILGMVAVLMVARAVAIYGISLIGSILVPRSFNLPLAEQNVLFFGGLVRGAISWAQVVQVRDVHRGVMVTTTLGVILFTVVIFGAVMPFFTRHLMPEDEALPSRRAVAAAAADYDDEEIPMPHSAKLTTIVSQQELSINTLLPPQRAAAALNGKFNKLRGTSAERRISTPDAASGAAAAAAAAAGNGGGGNEDPALAALVPLPAQGMRTPGGSFRSSHVRQMSDGASTANAAAAAAAVAAAARQLTGMGHVYSAWAWFDDNVMKPVFGGSSHRHGERQGGGEGADRGGAAPPTPVMRGPRTRTYSGMARLNPPPPSYGSVQQSSS